MASASIACCVRQPLRPLLREFRSFLPGHAAYITVVAGGVAVDCTARRGLVASSRAGPLVLGRNGARGSSVVAVNASAVLRRGRASRSRRRAGRCDSSSHR
jgi:hypothetical protein